jgi:hypothetical protein
MRTKTLFLAGFCAMLFVGACSDDGAGPGGAADDWSRSGDDLGPGSAGPRTEGRVPRRLSIAQIDETIRATFGDTWVAGDPPARLEIFPILGPMLGQPDYLGENSESLDPTPLFAKFMDNMASKMCLDAVLKDLAPTPPAKPIILRFRADPDKNLRYLRLLLHAVYVPENSTQEIADLRVLHDQVLANSEPQYAEALAWTGVCIAMLTAPEFMTY